MSARGKVQTVFGAGFRPTERAAGLTAVRHAPGVAAAVLAAAAAGWWWTSERMAGMGAGLDAWPSAFASFMSTWAVMMAAMMLPGLAPIAAGYARLAQQRPRGRWGLFVAGYLLAWSVAGLAAFALVELGRGLLGGERSWDSGGRWLAAGALVLAAVYQLTPLKRACLARCRSAQPIGRRPLSERAAGALVDGVGNGCWCIGSSWALMSFLLAVGSMSPAWMASVAALVAFEKAASSGARRS